MEARSPNYWTTKEFPTFYIFIFPSCLFSLCICEHIFNRHRVLKSRLFTKYILSFHIIKFFVPVILFKMFIAHAFCNVLSPYLHYIPSIQGNFMQFYFLQLYIINLKVKFMCVFEPSAIPSPFLKF